MGGVLQYIDPQGRYLRVKSMISNNIQPFSVQIKDSDVYYKEMKKKDPRYTELVDKFGTNERLERSMRIFDGLQGEDVDRIVRYINKHCKGELSTLTIEHQRSRHRKKNNDSTRMSEIMPNN